MIELDFAGTTRPRDSAGVDGQTSHFANLEEEASVSPRIGFVTAQRPKPAGSKAQPKVSVFEGRTLGSHLGQRAVRDDGSQCIQQRRGLDMQVEEVERRIAPPS